MKGKRHSGFTIVEVLATVAIIVILLGVSAGPLVSSASNHINGSKITELDNAAREIYMAAANRAELLGEELSRKAAAEAWSTATGAPLVAGGLGDLKFCFSDRTIGDVLLPVGSIDETLRENGHCFYIVYHGGGVTTVLYAEENMDVVVAAGGTVGTDEAEAYAGKSREERMNGDVLVGVYSGAPTGHAGYDPFAPEEAKGRVNVKVEVINDERLTARVTLDYDGDIADALGEAINGGALQVRLGDLDPAVSALDSGNSILLGSTPTFTGANPFTYSIILDSLDGQRFKDLEDSASGTPVTDYVTLGGDFRITADIPGDYDFEVVREDNTRTANSLFENGSNRSGVNENRAIITKLRHLQNLSTAYSGVDLGVDPAVNPDDAAIKSAVQMISINAGTYFGDPYTFEPISNANLLLYNGGEDGEGMEIRDLTLKTSASADVGLFVSAPASVNGVKLANPRIEATTYTMGSVGALAGTASGATIRDCRVYWEINSSNTGDYHIGAYRAGVNSTTYAGGLAGQVSNSKIENCYVYWTADSTASSIGDRYQIRGAYAGGVAGRMQKSQFTGCRVYWAGDSEDVQTALVNETEYNYQINGRGQAGGLAGNVVSSNIEITDSLAAAMVSGISSNAVVGGLAGHVGTDIKITNSYADCYLAWTGTGTETWNAGGLVGNLVSGGTATLNKCYAAGFIIGSPTQSAGLSLGDGSISATNVYSAVLQPAALGDYDPSAAITVENQPFVSVPLTGHTTAVDTFSNVYFLGTGIVTGASGTAKGVSYTDLSDFTTTGTSGSTLKGAGFTDGKLDDETYPYELCLTISGNRDGGYIYPGLMTYNTPIVSLPHYGDWGELIVEDEEEIEVTVLGLVYYEQYSTNWGFSGGGNAEAGTVNYKDGSDESDTRYVVDDGYAVAFKVENDELPEGTMISITTSAGGTIDGSTAILVYEDDSASASVYYYIIPLANNTTYYPTTPETPFYNKSLKITGASVNSTSLEGDKINDAEYRYNPHFADTVASGVDESYIPDMIRIRTARNLYFLSQYCNSDKAADKTYNQELDVNYGTYTGTNGISGAFSAITQSPIGIYTSSSNKHPFTGWYNGGGYSITGLSISSGTYQGLFGYVDGGKVEYVNVVGGSVSGGMTGERIGGVVGCNEGGTVQHCSYSGSVSGGSSGTGGVGGVVGHNNTGDVLFCYNTGGVSAMSYVGSAGGVVGYNEGNVTYCYNIGKVENGNNTGGVVGEHKGGTVSNCYNTGEVNTVSRGGGVVGYVGSCSLENSYNIGKVSADSLLGASAVGGVAGRKDSGGSVTGCFFLSTTAPNGIGNNGGGTSDVTAIDDVTNFAKKSVFESKSWVFTSTAGPWVMCEVTGEAVNRTVDYRPGLTLNLEVGLAEKNFPEEAETVEDVSDVTDLVGAVGGGHGVPEDAYYVLDKDLDLSGIDWAASIGGNGNQEKHQFNATFDGNGHTIYMGNNQSSLFGTVGKTGVVKNLNVVCGYPPEDGAPPEVNGRINQSETKDYVGGIVGINYGQIINCTFKGVVQGDKHSVGIGGIAGLNDSGATVSNCIFYKTLIPADVEFYATSYIGANKGTQNDNSNVEYYDWYDEG